MGGGGSNEILKVKLQKLQITKTLQKRAGGWQLLSLSIIVRY